MTDKKNISGLLNHNKELNLEIIKSIQDALFILMKNKDYNSISICELCKKAGVSRMAFYNNYKSKDEVIYSIVNNVNKKIVGEVGSPFDKKISLDWYYNMFLTIKKNKDFLALIFDANFKYRYLSMINDLVLRNINSISLEEKNMRILWAGGIVNRIIKWIEDDMSESPEILADYCYNKLSNFIK